MKKPAGIVLSSVPLPLLLCALLYLKYDSKGYDYGFGCTFCNTTLPYQVTPKFNFDYPQHFVLLDDEGYELIGSGFKYNLSSFKANKILAYGYRDTAVVVQCTDSTNHVRYLRSYETGYKSSKGNPEIGFKDLNSSDFEKVRQQYHWIDLASQQRDQIRLYRTLALIVALISLLLLVKKIYN
jgi:hypothetical protein